jgi:hypothetical protein
VRPQAIVPTAKGFKSSISPIFDISAMARQWLLNTNSQCCGEKSPKTQRE